MSPHPSDPYRQQWRKPPVVAFDFPDEVRGRWGTAPVRGSKRARRELMRRVRAARLLDVKQRSQKP